MRWPIGRPLASSPTTTSSVRGLRIGQTVATTLSPLLRTRRGAR